MNRRDLLLNAPAALAASVIPAEAFKMPDAPVDDLPETWKRQPIDERIELLRNHLMDAIYDSAPEGVEYFEITISEREGHERIIARGFNESYRLFLYRPQKFVGWHECCPRPIPN